MYIRSLYLAFVLLCLGNAAFAQKTPCSGASVIDLVPGAVTRQSSFFTGEEPGSCGKKIGKAVNPFDPVHTQSENNPWFEIDLQTQAQLTGIQFDHPSEASADGFQKFYIIFSLFPIEQTDLGSVLANPAVDFIYVSEPIASGTVIPLDNRSARFVRVQSALKGELHCDKAALFGNPVKSEIFNNNVDDDCDGKIDLADTDVKPIIRNVLVIPGNDKGQNGSIVIEARGENLRYSLDGGRKFQKPAQQEGDYITISVAPGTYNLVLAGAGDVTTEYEYNPLDVAAPEVTACGNGDFSQGFNNWTGWIGNHNTNGGITVTNNNLDPAGVRHAIIASSNANDPNVGANIPLNSPSGSNRFARLGGTGQSNSNAQGMSFCYQVNPNNANLSFWISAVLFHSPSADHLPPFSSSFSYTVTTAAGAVIASNNYLPGPGQNTQAINNTLYFLPWTCVSVNLNQFIGQQICVNFTSAGCAWGGHGGYGYVDGLCNYMIRPALTGPSAVCLPGGIANVVPNGGQGINSYQWMVEMIDSDGNGISGTQVFGAPLTPPLQPLNDVIGFWQASAADPFIKCGQRFRVNLFVNGNSGLCNQVANRVSLDITANCVPDKLDYCDLVVCNNATSVTMQSSNTCSTCQYNWAPANYLNNSTLAYPSITNNAGLNANYTVTITSSTGCSITEDVKVYSVGVNGYLTASYKCYDKCTSTLEALYYSTKAISVNLFTVIATSTSPSQTLSFSFVSMETLPNGTFKYKFVSQPFENKGTGFNGDNPVIYTVTISSQTPTGPGICQVGNNCSNTTTTTVSVPRGLFWGIPNCYIPNVFCATASNPVNRIFNPFFSTTQTAVYWMEMEIYDRWGGLVYKNEYPNTDHPFNPDCSTTSGLVGNESGFPWNGHWNNNINGPFVETGVYTYIIRYRNCAGEIMRTGDVAFLMACGEAENDPKPDQDK